jgi:F-type H+-transporting ATPase subunit b
LEKLGLNLGYIFVQIFNFLILFIVLRAWVYKPILGLLEKRRKVIAEGIENARVAAEARANAEKEAAKILAEAQAEANRIVSSRAQRRMRKRSATAFSAICAARSRPWPSPRPRSYWVKPSMRSASTR